MNLKNKKIIVDGESELISLVKILCWDFKIEYKLANFDSGFVWLETTNETPILHWCRSGFDGYSESKKKQLYYKDVVSYFVDKITNINNLTHNQLMKLRHDRLENIKEIDIRLKEMQSSVKTHT